MSGLFLAIPHIRPSSAWSTTLKTPLSSSSHRITFGLCAGLLSTLSSQCVILAFPTLLLVDLLEILGEEDVDDEIDDEDDPALLSVLTFESLLQQIIQRFKVKFYFAVVRVLLAYTLFLFERRKQWGQMTKAGIRKSRHMLPIL